MRNSASETSVITKHGEIQNVKITTKMCEKQKESPDAVVGLVPLSHILRQNRVFV